MTRILRLPVVSAVAISLVLCTPAQAQATITVGSPLTAAFHPIQYCVPICTAALLALPEPGASAASPTSGVIVRWHVFQASGAEFKLRVLRPSGEDTYMGAGTSAAETPSGAGLQTFDTYLPIQVGDVLGIDATSVDAKLGYAPVPGAQMGGLSQPSDGSSEKARTLAWENTEAAFNAEVQTRPSVTQISPATGGLEGGETVNITGMEFAGVSAVQFGGIPALRFTVESENLITAVVPPGAAPGSVGVVVTTFVGTSPPVDGARYTYESRANSSPRCVVPQFRGKTLRAARRRAHRADCKVGKVRKRKGSIAKTAKVARQSPKPGVVLAPGGKVNVKLGG